MCHHSDTLLTFKIIAVRWIVSVIMIKTSGNLKVTL